MSIDVQIIADSISTGSNVRLTTFKLRYPRFIHAELMTHRVFSRNASSSRAIPVKRAINAIREEPARPEHWGLNKPGMQAADEPEDVATLAQGQQVWDAACEIACVYAEQLADLGFHKQIVNRLTEPFQHINVVVTATQWSNWYALRAHPDAQPEIRILAQKMQELHEEAIPLMLHPGDWHLPFIQPHEYADYNDGDSGLEILKKVSAARCARTSYVTFDGKPSTISEDEALCEKLIGGVPLHASPFEHQATPDTMTVLPLGHGTFVFHDAIMYDNTHLHGNLEGWCQYRKYLDGECQ